MMVQTERLALVRIVGELEGVSIGDIFGTVGYEYEGPNFGFTFDYKWVEKPAYDWVALARPYRDVMKYALMPQATFEKAVASKKATLNGKQMRNKQGAHPAAIFTPEELQAFPSVRQGWFALDRFKREVMQVKEDRVKPGWYKRRVKCLNSRLAPVLARS